MVKLTHMCGLLVPQTDAVGKPAAPLVCPEGDWKYWNNLSSSASGLGQLVIYNEANGRGYFLPLPQELLDSDGDLNHIHKTHTHIGVQTYLAPYQRNVRGMLQLSSASLHVTECLLRQMFAPPHLLQSTSM